MSRLVNRNEDEDGSYLEEPLRIKCVKCKRNFPISEMNGGFCANCIKIVEKEIEKEKKKKKIIDRAKKDTKKLIVKNSNKSEKDKKINEGHKTENLAEKDNNKICDDKIIEDENKLKHMLTLNEESRELLCNCNSKNSSVFNLYMSNDEIPSLVAECLGCGQVYVFSPSIMVL